MYIRFGDYSYPTNAGTIAISGSALRTAAQIKYGMKWSWKVTGFLQAATQAALTASIQGLMAAHQVETGKAIGLFFDDGTPTAHVANFADTYGGVRITSGPEFPDGQGAQYSTYRDFTVGYEYDQRDFTVGLIDWQETLKLAGGGPRLGILELLEELPQKQTLNRYTPYRATQSGSATGHIDYPVPPAPLFPEWLIQAPEITRVAPKRIGDVFTDYAVQWSYEFVSPLPLNGLPNRQPNR